MLWACVGFVFLVCQYRYTVSHVAFYASFWVYFGRYAAEILAYLWPRPQNVGDSPPLVRGGGDMLNYNTGSDDDKWQQLVHRMAVYTEYTILDYFVGFVHEIFVLFCEWCYINTSQNKYYQLYCGKYHTQQQDDKSKLLNRGTCICNLLGAPPQTYLCCVEPRQ